MSNELTKKESDRLTYCISVVTKGVSTFVEVGNALAEIRESKLYRVTHKTFEAFCQEHWNFTRRRANQLIEAATVAEEMGTVVPKVSTSVETKPVQTEPVVTSERVARAVSSVPKEDRQEVIEEAAKKGPLTSASVKAAAEAVAEAKEPEPVLDEEGRAVPEALTPLFAERDSVQALSRDVIALRKRIEFLASTPVGAAIDLNDCESHLKHVQISLTGWKPHAVCPYSSRDHKTCGACKGRKWLTKIQWKAVPEEIRKAALA